MSTEAASRPEPGEDFLLAGWLVQPRLNRLSTGARTVQLEPRTMDVLAYLARHAGRVVPREEILEGVWRRHFVADATLSHAVAVLRRVLGDSARQPRFIETISKRGYRVVATVQPAVGACAGSPAPVERAGDCGAREPAVPPSVAVLPFVDMSAARDQEYLCDGVAEEITNALAQLDGLKVAARTSAYAFKGKLEDVREIGRRLGVDAVLEGSVRKSGDRLRVTVQLINAADGLHLWSERFDRTDEDIFAIQDEISLGVVERLKVRLMDGEAGLLGRRNPTSRQAYDLYLRGRHLLNRRRAGEVQQAVEYFEQAIAADSTYVFPHVAIAEMFSILGLWGFIPPAVALGRAKEAASRAVAIDDSLGEAHAWLAMVLYFKEWDWVQGSHHFARVLQLPRPGSACGFGLGIHHLIGGRHAAVAEVARRLVEAEPISSIAYTQAASLHVGLGEFDAAAALLEKALELDPELPMALLWQGFCRAALGRLAEAVRLLRAAAASGLTASMIALPAVLVRAGDVAASREAVEALERTARERYVPPITRALAWAALDDRERTRAFLGAAEVERSPMFTMALTGAGYLALAPAWVQEWFAGRRRQLGPSESPAAPAAAGASRTPGA
jgi:TolB-like protein/Tfp pilus assembly protein PilF